MALPGIYLLILFCTVSAATQRPGVELQLSQLALDTAASVAVDQLSGKLQNQPISDQHGKTKAAGGKVDYDITNMRIVSFTKPSSRVTLNPGTGLTWSTTGAGVSIHGDWHYSYRKHFIHIRDKGSLDVTAWGIDFSISIKMGVDKAGRPTIFTTGCSSSVARLKVKFHHGASWLYNLFDHQIAKTIKKKLQDVMCTAATKSINEDGDKKLADLNIETKVGKQMLLDYRLLQAPVFGKGFIKSMHKGEVSWRTDPRPYPGEAAPFPPVSNTTRMVYITASEAVINSCTYAAFTHGMASFNLSADQLPPEDRGFLNTTCKSFACMGNFLSQAAAKYPNSSVIIDMRTTEAPFVHVSPKGINLTFNGHMIFRAKTPQDKVVYLFTMALGVNMSVNTWLEDHTVKADVESYTPKVKVIDSVIGHISDGNMQFIFKQASKMFILKKLKELGTKGMDLPNIRGVKYVKPDLHLNDGSLMFATDVIWSPKLFKHLEGKSLFNKLNLG